MGVEVVLLADAGQHDAAARLREMLPDRRVEVSGDLREAAARVESEDPGVFALLEAPIAAHDERVAAVRRLRSIGYTGAIITAAGFLTERREIVDAGADYAFDPARQAVERVVAAALVRARVAADHPYLKALFVGMPAVLEGYGEALPDGPLDVALLSTSLHDAPAFYEELPDWRSRHAGCSLIVVEDGGGDDIVAEALATGADHYVVLEEAGIGGLQALVRGELRQRWLARVSAA